MREIEKVTKMTNDYICDSHGTIVTEYCKRLATWENYRDNYHYEPDEKFLEEVIPVEMLNEEVKAAKKEQKDTNNLQAVMDLVAQGPGYWTNVLNEGVNHSIISYQEHTALQQMIKIASTGNIPASRTGKLTSKTMSMFNQIMAVCDKMESEGILK